MDGVRFKADAMRIWYRALAVGLLAVMLGLALGPAGGEPLRAAEDEAMQLSSYVQILYDDRNGLATGEANTILQDANGYIWIGSYSGLTRYDSTSFELYANDPEGFNSSTVRTLFEDSSGRIWIGTNDQGVFVYEGGAFTQVSGIASNSVRAFTEGRDHRIYIGSTSGIAVVDTDQNVTALSSPQLEEETVYNLLCDHNGVIWGTTVSGALFAMREEEVMLFYPKGELVADELHGLVQDAQGRILIGTGGNQVVVLTLRDGRYTEESLSIAIMPTYSLETINSLYLDCGGRVWVCSDTGVGYFNSEGVLYEIKGLQADIFVEQMIEDYEGNLWLASSRYGVLELIHGKFTHTNQASGLENVVANVTQMYNGLLFVGTDEGLKVLDSDQFTPIGHPLSTMLDGIRVRGITADANGNLWICTYKDYGVIRYNETAQELVSISSALGLSSDRVRSALPSRSGDMIVATGGGVNIIRDDEVIDIYNEQDGLANPVILSLYEDQRGNILAGSDGNGIYVIAPDGTVSNYNEADGLTSGVILNMVFDPAHRGLWISTGAEFCFWDEHGIHPIKNLKVGAGSIFDFKLVGDELWVLKSNCIVIADRADILSGEPAIDYTLLDKSDGLTDSITSNSRHYMSAEGMLYLGTGSGVYSINTAQIYQNQAVPRAIINQVTVDDRVYHNPSSIVIPSTSRRVNIDFTALSFSTADCTLEYNLQGFDEEPVLVDGDEHRNVGYTNLPGGTYVFTLKVKNSAGIAGEEVRLVIDKQLGLLERPGVIALLVLLGVGLLLLLISRYTKYKTKKLVEQRQWYKDITEQALRTVAHTIDAKDVYTHGHSERVAGYSVEIGRRLGMSQEETEDLYYVALLHDIGKIGVPDNILNKPARLTDEEYDVIKLHPTVGGSILEDFSTIKHIAEGAKYHHERYDGSGYNEGLKGEEIPLFARIIGVADAFDAMTSPRVYRPGLSREIVEEELRKGIGTQFDPRMAQIMLDMISDKVTPL